LSLGVPLLFRFPLLGLPLGFCSTAAATGAFITVSTALGVRDLETDRFPVTFLLTTVFVFFRGVLVLNVTGLGVLDLFPVDCGVSFLLTCTIGVFFVTTAVGLLTVVCGVFDFTLLTGVDLAATFFVLPVFPVVTEGTGVFNLFCVFLLSIEPMSCTSFLDLLRLRPFGPDEILPDWMLSWSSSVGLSCKKHKILMKVIAHRFSSNIFCDNSDG
jgi:hypothetical protein